MIAQQPYEAMPDTDIELSRSLPRQYQHAACRLWVRGYLQGCADAIDSVREALAKRGIKISAPDLLTADESDLLYDLPPGTMRN
jgi:hypothetical protein